VTTTSACGFFEDGYMARNEMVVGSQVQITGFAKATKALRQLIGKRCPEKNGKQTKGETNFNILPAEELVALTEALVKMLRALGASLEDAMEITQDAMLEAVRENSIKYPRAWLRQVAKRRLFASGRKDRVQKKYLGTRISLDVAFPAVESSHEVEVAEMQEIIREGVDKLPARQRLILAYILDGWSYDEIAEALDCHSNTVRNRYRKARDSLAKIRAIRQCL
jgi:RNA polymerase sigma factor (sigma-70 family)